MPIRGATSDGTTFPYLRKAGSNAQIGGMTFGPSEKGAVRDDNGKGGERVGRAGGAGYWRGEAGGAEHCVGAGGGGRGRGGELHGVEGGGGGARRGDSLDGAARVGGWRRRFEAPGRRKIIYGGGERIRQAGHSGEQRGHLSGGEVRRHHRRAVGPHDEREPEVAIPVRAGGGADHETPGTRQDHQFGVAGRVAVLHALLRVEGGMHHADAVPGARVGAGNSGERRRAGDDSVSRRSAG
jgi:hypothetical protein